MIVARALLVEDSASLQSRHAGRHRGIREQRLKADELAVAILLKDGRGKSLATHHENGLAIFLELVDQRDEVAHHRSTMAKAFTWVCVKAISPGRRARG